MTWPFQLPSWEDIFRGISEAITKPIVDSLAQLTQYLSPVFQPIEDAINGLVSSFWQTVTTGFWQIADVLSTYLSPLFDTVGAVLSRPLESIYSTLSGLGDTIWGGINDLITSISGGFQGFIGWVSEGFSDLVNTLGNVPQMIVNAINGFVATVDNAVNQIIRTIDEAWYKFLQLTDQINEWIHTASHMIDQTIKNMNNTIQQRLDEFNKWMEQQFTTVRETQVTIEDVIHTVVVEPFPYLTNKIIIPAIEKLWDFAKRIWEEIKPSLQEIYDALKDPVKDFTAWFTGIATKLLDLFSPEEQAAWSMLTYIRNAVEYEGPATPEKAMQAAANYLSIVMGMSFADAGLTFGENLIQSILGSTIAGTGLGFGKGGRGLGFARLFRSLQFNLGLNWLTWVIFGQMFRAVIADPLERYYRWRYRTTYPTRSEIQEWLRTRQITTEEAINELRWLGYDEKYIEHVLRSAYREVSFSMWIDMRGYGLISDEDLEKAIESLGYPPELTGLIVHYAKMRVLDERISRLRSRLASAYVDGYYSRKSVRDMLVGLGLQEEFVDWFLKSYDIDHDIEIRELMEKALFEAYEKGKISEDELRERLSEIIADPKILELKILYKKLQLVPKERYDYLLTLEDRKRRAEFKIRSLELQIKYLMDRRKENAEYYQARINLLIEQYDEKISKLRKELDEAVAEIEERYKHIFTALEDEFANYGDKPVEQLTERIMALRKQLETARGLRAEVLEAKITLLTELSRVPLADRPAVFEAVMSYYRQQMRNEINSVKAEYEERIRQEEEERDARIRVLQEQMEKTDKYFEERISKLAVQLEEAKADLDVIQKLIEMKVSS
ncbi:MAG: phage tail protein [Candidatus Methanospirareceae archaeon]